MFESRHHSELSGLCIEVVLRFGGRDVSDRFEQAAIVEPVDPFQRCELDGLQAAPWPAPVNHLGLEEADHRLGERVIVAVADAADRRLDTGLSQTLGVFDREVLDAPVAMVDEPIR